MQHKSRDRSLLVFLAILMPIVLSVTSACEGSAESADGEPGSASPTPDPYDGMSVIQPGKPGEEASTGAVTPTSPAPPDHADFAFMQMMVPHHAQALDMTRLARTRAADPSVRRLAARIRAAQGPEILTMSAWLEREGVAVPQPGDDPAQWDHSEHGHAPMLGMLTSAQLRELAAASGQRFDRLFLRAMIRHHGGALAMAERVARTGTDQMVSELAAEVHVTQSSEIALMRDFLKRL
jgi:uncharacterized protein (DUF305 family)